MIDLVIHHHMGLGDHYVCNALVRHYAKDYHVHLPVKKHNFVTVKFMFRDIPNITVVAVGGDDDVEPYARMNNYKLLNFGMFAPDFDWGRWDQSFYKQCDIPIADRWNNFHVDRIKEAELKAPALNYAFVHEDPERGYGIKKELIKLPRVHVVKNETDNAFNYCTQIENATEIHCIDSSFIWLADFMKLRPEVKLFYHKYAKNDYGPSLLHHDWKILKTP